MYSEDVAKIKQNTKNERSAISSFVFWFCIFLGLIFLDQLVKYLVFGSSFGNQLNLLKPIFAKQNFENYNFAFSLSLPIWLMYIVYILVLASILRYLKKNVFSLSALELTGWTLVLAGACANVFERVFLGYVRDFILFANGIFNLADVFIFLGIIILLIFQTNKQKNDI